MNANQQRAERALIEAMGETAELLEWDSQTAPHAVRLALAERIVSVLSDAIYLDLDSDQKGPAA